MRARWWILALFALVVAPIVKLAPEFLREINTRSERDFSAPERGSGYGVVTLLRGKGDVRHGFSRRYKAEQLPEGYMVWCVEGDYVNDKPHGVFTSYSRYGEITEQQEFNHGKLVSTRTAPPWSGNVKSKPEILVLFPRTYPADDLGVKD